MTRTAPVVSAVASSEACRGGQPVVQRGSGGAAQLWIAAAPCATSLSRPLSVASSATCSIPGSAGRFDRVTTRTAWPCSASSRAVAAPAGPYPTIT